jgi:hypothetical protein
MMRRLLLGIFLGLAVTLIVMFSTISAVSLNASAIYAGF